MAVRNRIIFLQEPVVARDSFGGEVITWTTQATVWASFENVGKATEKYIHQSSKDRIVRMGQFGIIPPHVNFDERWRIVETDGLARTWNVVGIGKEEHRDWTITVKA